MAREQKEGEGNMERQESKWEDKESDRRNVIICHVMSN